MKRVVHYILLSCTLFGLAALLLFRPPHKPDTEKPQPPTLPTSLDAPLDPAEQAAPAPTPHTPRAPQAVATPHPAPHEAASLPPDTDMPAPTPANESITLEPTPVPTQDIQVYHERFQAAARIELVHIPPLARTLQNHPDPSSIRQLYLPVPEGDMLPVSVASHKPIAPLRGVFTGQVEGQPLSEVIVSYYQEAITASIIIPGIGHYEIAYAGDNNHLLLEIDPGKILPEAPPLIPTPPDHQETPS